MVMLCVHSIGLQYSISSQLINDIQLTINEYIAYDWIVEKI